MVDSEKLRAEFAARLHKACDDADVRRHGRAVDLQKALKARGISATTTAIGKWLNAEAMPTRPNMVALAEWLRVRVEWLEWGKPAADAPDKPESNAELIGMMSPWDSSTPLYEDEVAVPLYKEVEMAAGDGRTHAVERTGRLLRFARSTLRECGVQPEHAACATVSGRSMERLIMDGATIGIDLGTTDIIDGEIYAIDHDGMLRVKYLYRLPGGGLRIRSENSTEYPDETIQPADLQHIRVLGWVFWWSTVRRRKGSRIAS
jgi:phage repressor protein C with HTH and peptisase S24 domain